MSDVHPIRRYTIGVANGRNGGMNRHPGSMIVRLAWDGQGRFARCQLLCRFLDAGNNEVLGTLS